VDHPDTKIRTILGSSGKLTAQIRHGAPYQLFLSADTGYPEALRRSGDAVTEPKVYARGGLVLFSTKPRDFSGGLKILRTESVGKIVIANPRTAPYGRAAEEALKKSGLLPALRSRLVYAESVSQAVTYVLNAVDAGLIPKSALSASRLRKYRKGKNWVEVDPALYRPIEQSMVLLKPGADDPEARAFYDFLLSPPARGIFRRYGYLLP